MAHLRETATTDEMMKVFESVRRSGAVITKRMKKWRGEREEEEEAQVPGLKVPPR